MTRYRNPLACHPLLRKGHAHQVSKSSVRQANKQFIDDEINEMMDEWDEVGLYPSGEDLVFDEDIHHMFYEE